MVAEEGKRPVLGSWRDPDLPGTIDEGFRMVVLEQGSARTLVTRLVGAIRSSQRETPITALVSCWSHLEVGAHRAADFFISKPFQLTQIRRVPALASSPRTKAVGHVPKMPAGSA